MSEETCYLVTSCIPLKKGHYEVSFLHADGDTCSMTIHEETVIEYRLVEKKELTQTTFSQVMVSGAFATSYGYAVSILSRRMYTQKEIREKLKERSVESKVIKQVIDKLLALQLLDDASYASAFIESQLSAGKKSHERIRMDLLQKGVSSFILEDLAHLFDEVQEFDVIMNEITQSWRRYARKELTDFERRAKIVAAVCRKGFDVDDVLSQYQIFIDENS